jgi:hypothetical protein
MKGNTTIRVPKGFVAYLIPNFEHAYPHRARQNDRDDRWHIFLNITMEVSKSVKIMARVGS